MTDIVSNQQPTSMNMFEVMEKAYKFAMIIAKSDIIPVHYRNKPENVFIAVQTAYRINLDPMLVMQNTYVVGGKLGMNTTFAISMANNSGLFANGLRYKVEGEGDNLQVTAYTNIKKTGETISYTISMRQAMAEGWTKNSKYKTLPDLMLRYRAATFLIRTHAPEVLNGMHMVEELEDISLSATSVQPKTTTLSNQLNSVLDSYEKRTSLNDQVFDAEETEQRTKLFNLIEQHNVPESITTKWCEKADVASVDSLPTEYIGNCINFIEERYAPSE